MQERSFHTGKASNFISTLLAGLVLATMPCHAEPKRGNLEAVLIQNGYEQIELRRTGENHLFLFGQVNGRRRSCLLDTGWSLTTIRTNAAHPLNPSGTVQELKLGRVILKDVPVVERELLVNGRPTAFDLVLGCDFLLYHHAVIDCQGRRLYLRHEALAREPAEQLTVMLQKIGWVAVSMARREPLALSCASKFTGQDVGLLVDTGAMWSCLDAETARILGLRADPSANRISGTATAGKRGFGVARVKTLELGSWKMNDVNFAVLDLADWGLGANGKALPGVNGILGGDELAARAAIIDCAQLKLWLRLQ